MYDNQTEKTAKELESERGRQIQRAIADEANQFKKDFYAELRELGYRINTEPQLHPKRFGYDKKIIPVFEKYLKKAESVRSYYHIGGFSNYVQLMLFCVASPNLKEMTPFMVERYMFAVKSKAPNVILESYARTIFAMKDKKYLSLYRTLLEEEYIAFSASSIIAIFNKLKVYDIEDKLIELLEYRAELDSKRKYKESGKAFYALGDHLNVCYASIKTLGDFKSKKALPYIQGYLTPENKVEYDPKVLDEKEYAYFLKTLKKVAQEAIDKINN